MMLLSYANAVLKYDRRRSGLPSAPIDMEHEYNAIEI